MLDFNKRNIRTWSMLGSRRLFGVVLEELAERDDRFVFVTADVGRYYAINRFIEKYPDRIINVGISEQNMIGVAAGLAKEGYHPMVATYATFATARVLDQIRVNMGLMELGIVVVGVSSGLAEGDMSATHMGLEDIADMTAIPNITVLSPADAAETISALLAAMECGKPTYVRLTGTQNCPIVYSEEIDYRIGRINRLADGGDGAILATGTIVSAALKARNSILQNTGKELAVYDMHTLKPISEAFIHELLKYNHIITVEEHQKYGGLGSIIATELSACGKCPRQLMLAVDDYYPKAGTYESLLEETGLTAEKMTERIQRFLG